jgi:acyl-CoA thioesterase 11
MVNRAFRTSMEVGVRVEAESLHTGDRRYCCSAYLTFVALGPDGRPRGVPQVYPETPDEERRYEAALKRREDRLAERGGAIRPLVPGDEQLALDVHQGRRQSIVAGQLRHSVTRMVHKIFPQHANSVEVTFGGQIMAWMEVGAYVSASRFSHTGTLVMASLDSLSFLSPTKVGDLVHIVAKVNSMQGTGPVLENLQRVVTLCELHIFDLAEY